MVANGPERSSSPVSVDDLNAAFGIKTTPEGRARARRELDRAAAARTPERRNALRAKLGLPPLPVE